MDKSAIFFSQLLILGAFVCMTTAVSLRHKRNLIAEYQWPEPNPEINQFPHETTCHYYYLVLSEEDITVNKCPDGELFDYFDHKCSKKETARCWSRRFGKMKHHHIPLKSRGPFTCPYAWGKYPDLKDCTKYYVCLSGKVKHKKCAPYEHFDKVSRKCVASIDGVCADQTDVMDPDYMCPRTWGSFSFSKDCSKYYECLEKNPSLRTCPTDTLFHERKEKCLPQNHVRCGSRHNPYSKKEETLAIDETTQPENPSVTSSKPIHHTESEVKITSQTKMSTIDPNSIIIERMPSTPDASQTILMSTKGTQSPKELTTEEHAGELSNKNSTPLMLNETQSDITNGELSIKNMTPLILNETQSDITNGELSNKNLTPLMLNETQSDITTGELSIKNMTPLILNETQSDITNGELSNKNSTPLMLNETQSDITTGELSNKNLTPLMLNETQSDIITGELSSDNAQNSSPLVLNETKVTDLPSKQSVSNETESLMDVNNEIISVNGTDEITDDDSGNMGEFIEISTSETKSSSSSSVTQTIAVASSQSVKAEIGEIKVQQTTVELPQVTQSDECSPKDPTCITEESGRIVRCPTAAGLHPYPGDERRFLVCENSNIRVRYCSGDGIFNSKEKKCIGSFIF